MIASMAAGVTLLPSEVKYGTSKILKKDLDNGSMARGREPEGKKLEAHIKNTVTSSGEATPTVARERPS